MYIENIAVAFTELMTSISKINFIFKGIKYCAITVYKKYNVIIIITIIDFFDCKIFLTKENQLFLFDFIAWRIFSNKNL